MQNFAKKLFEKDYFLTLQKTIIKFAEVVKVR